MRNLAVVALTDAKVYEYAAVCLRLCSEWFDPRAALARLNITRAAS
jgi:hypothetical protein